MTQNHRWIETAGGPHLLVAEELLPYWRGTEGWHDHTNPKDQSDYARACKINSWLGTISCHDGTAVVLSGEAGPIAWMPAADNESGRLVQWIGVDDEKQIDIALGSEELKRLLGDPDVENIEFQTGHSGVMRLFDSVYSGLELRGDSQLLALRRGGYRIAPHISNRTTS